jgi:hypothetical protein
MKTLLTFGGGTNSSAIIAGIIEKDLPRPDLILFANTGGEKPHTYQHIDWMQSFLKQHGFPEITIVKRTLRNGTSPTLEDDVLRLKTLPSIAFGWKTCSQKFKIAPQDQYCNKFFKEDFKQGNKVVKYIGYDFAEERRWMKMKVEDDKYVYKTPLVDWQWDRQECVESLKRIGIPQPGKSACFYCPSTKKSEIFELKQHYPELLNRALTMESVALSGGKLKSCAGLGRNKSWQSILDTGDNDDSDRSVCSWCVDFEE